MPKRILSSAIATFLMATATVAAPEGLTEAAAEVPIEYIAEKPVVLVERGDDPIFGALFLSATRLVAANGFTVELEKALETKGAPEGIIGISQFFSTDRAQFASMQRLCGGDVNFVTVSIFKATPKMVEVGFHSTGPGSDGNTKVVDCARPEFDLVAIADVPEAALAGGSSPGALAAGEPAGASVVATQTSPDVKPRDPEDPMSGLPDPSEVAPPTEGDPGKWQKSIRTNPMDDSKTVLLALKADQGQSRMGKPVTLFARCQSNTTEVYINWNDYLGDDSRDVYEEWKNVQVRIGSKPAQNQRWGISTDNTATFAPGWAGSLLQQMVGEERMVVSTIPYNENPITAIFDISGLEFPLRELADTCGWSFVVPQK